MASHEEHRARAPKSATISIIIVSTSRYRKKMEGEKLVDLSGSLAASMLESHGHHVRSSRIVDDDILMIRRDLMDLLRDEAVDGVILVGGTGLSRRDVTIEAVSPLIEKCIEGFGELFRAESYKRVGTSAYLSRTVAGVISGKVVYCLPGSKDAVEVAMNLIIPEILHLIYIARS